MWFLKSSAVGYRLHAGYKAWEAAVNLIDGDREMEGKGKP